MFIKRANEQTKKKEQNQLMKIPLFLGQKKKEKEKKNEKKILQPDVISATF